MDILHRLQVILEFNSSITVMLVLCLERALFIASSLLPDKFFFRMQSLFFYGNTLVHQMIIINEIDVCQYISYF